MTVALVQSVGSSNGVTSTSSQTAAITTSNVTTGNLLVVMIQASQTSTGLSVTSVTDTGGNVYMRLNTSGPLNYNGVSSLLYEAHEYWIAIANSATGGTKPTATVHLSQSAPALNIGFAEFSYTAKCFIAVDTMAVLWSATAATVTLPPLYMIGNNLALCMFSQQTTTGVIWGSPSAWSAIYSSNYAGGGTNNNGVWMAYDANTTGGIGPTRAVTGSVTYTGSDCSLRVVPYAYCINGPTSGAASVASLPFTIALNTALTPNLGSWPADTVTVTDSSTGSFSQSSFTFAAGTTLPQFFTYTPPAGFTHVTLTFSSSAGLVLFDTTWSYTNSNQQYYVANAGSNANAGTSSGSPWQTLAHAIATIAVPGAFINLNGGDTFTENVTLTQGVTIQSYGAGQATFNGGSTLGTPGITAVNLDNITFQNLIMVQGFSSGVNGGGNGIVTINGTDTVRRSRGISFLGCTMSGAANAAIVIFQNGGASGGWNNVTIKNCTIFNCYEFGFFIGSSHTSGLNCFSGVQVTGCTIHDIFGFSFATSGGGGLLENLDLSYGPNLFSGNYIHDCGYDGTSSSGGGNGGVYSVYAEGLMFFGNLVQNITAPSGNSVDGVGIDFDINCKSCSIVGNFTSGCGGASAYAFATHTGYQPGIIAYNISVNDGLVNEGGINVNGNGYCLVYNNTVVSNNSFGAFGTGTAAVTWRALEQHLHQHLGRQAGGGAEQPDCRCGHAGQCLSDRDLQLQQPVGGHELFDPVDLADGDRVRDGLERLRAGR